MLSGNSQRPVFRGEISIDRTQKGAQNRLSGGLIASNLAYWNFAAQLSG
jgi:hypothetical protein